MIFAARFVVVDSRTIIKDAKIVVEEGVIVDIGPAESIKKREGIRLELKRHIIHPGFVNAHCHLDLSYLLGKIKPRKPFALWLTAIVAERRAASSKTIDAGIRKGISRLLETGTTTVGDISADGRSAAALIKAGIHGVVFHETLGYQPALAGQRLGDLKRRFNDTPDNRYLTSGVSPHACYSTSAKLMSEACRFAKRKNAPVAIHCAETEEELLFSRNHTGPLKDFLDNLGVYDREGQPRFGPVNVIKKAGALDNSILVHLNHPSHGDLASIKKTNSKVVYCPLSNRWFGRDDSNHPLPKLLKKSIIVGLGTDSLASNYDLDMAAECRQTMKNFGDISASQAFNMGTEAGAKTLGMPENHGTLRTGAPFNAVALLTSVRSSGSDKLFRAILSPGRKIGAVWTGGVRRYYDKEFMK